ncbi:MAG TPA: ABC transporter permease subunit [Acetobacteraceae bacterium]
MTEGFLTWLSLVSFGPKGWGALLAAAAGMTLAVSACAFLFGTALGGLGAWAKLSGGAAARGAAGTYTTVVRGVPELLVIYLFYFGGSSVATAVGRMLGYGGFLGLPAFAVGVLAVGTVSGAYQTEVIRGAFLAIPRGEIEAARAIGMGRLTMLQRIVGPRVLRFAMPGFGNVWQQVLKESTLISVTGLVEIMRQIHIAAGSTRLPFDFYITGFMLYLLLTTVSGQLFRGLEGWTLRPERRA